MSTVTVALAIISGSIRLLTASITTTAVAELVDTAEEGVLIFGTGVAGLHQEQQDTSQTVTSLAGACSSRNSWQSGPLDVGFFQLQSWWVFTAAVPAQAADLITLVTDRLQHCW
jgi:hypothetical protein